MGKLSIIYRKIPELKPYPRNARTHSRKQVKQIAAAIMGFGFTNPVLIDESDQIIAGHGRVAAAKLLGLKHDAFRFAHSLNFENSWRIRRV